MTRTLFYTVPMLHGADVKHFQHLAANNKYGDFFDGVEDGYYGELSREAARQCRFWLGYPGSGPNDWHNGVVGPRLVQFLDGSLALPAAYKTRRSTRIKNKPSLVKPLPTPMGPGSEFTYVDPEGAPDNNGVRHHAGKDWFAPGGTRVVSPVDGIVVEAKHSSDTSGQVFGGTIKIKADSSVLNHGRCTMVFRHVFPLDSILVNHRA